MDRRHIDRGDAPAVKLAQPAPRAGHETGPGLVGPSARRV